MLNFMIATSLFFSVSLLILFGFCIQYVIHYRNMVNLYFVRSNGFIDDWDTVSEKVKTIDGNPYPEMSFEIYEYERRKFINGTEPYS